MDERSHRGPEREVRDPAVEKLARSLDCEAEEVQSLYESVLTDMKKKAVIMDFLPIFALRKVKETLRPTRSLAAQWQGRAALLPVAH